MRRWIGPSSIATRLRIVLLTVAILMLVEPVIVYFTTNRLVELQNEATDSRIQAEFRQAELIREINDFSALDRDLRMITSPEALQTATKLMNDELNGLITSLTENSQAVDFQDIIKLLERYREMSNLLSDAQTASLGIQTTLAGQFENAQDQISDKLSVLRSEILARNVGLDETMRGLEAQTSEENIAAARQAFSDLLTLDTIADGIAEQRLILDAVGPGIVNEQPERQRQRARLQAQNLAVQIAKLPQGENQTRLAELVILMSDIMFDENGIFDQASALLSVTQDAENIAQDRGAITDQLLALSRSLPAQSQAEFTTQNESAIGLFQRTLWSTIFLTVVIGLILFFALFFVVERQFNARIAQLTQRVLAIANGQSDPGTTDSGNDELSIVNDALEVFKQNAAELRETNTSLQKRNDEVQQLGTRLETVLDTTSSGILAFDVEGTILLANRPARHFLGGISADAPFSRPAGITFLDREKLEPLDASSDPINRVIAGQVLNHEIALMDRMEAGDGRYVRLSSNRAKDPNSLVRMVLAIDDVSEAEQNRQQIERAGRLDALGQLTGGIAHDFNNLLATIQYAVQLSTHGDDPKKQANYRKIALESIERGSQLSSRLLSFAKRQPGIAKSHPLEQLIDDFRKLVEPTIEAAISIEFRIDEPNMNVFCDGPQLENALLNLVLNSRDAIMRSGRGNKIVVAARGVTEMSAKLAEQDLDIDRYSTSQFDAELRAQDDAKKNHSYRYVELSVTDDGPGMDDAVKRRALDPFFTTKSTNTGTGLGLSMVYGFVQQAGGELRVYSEIDVGTTMRILLPRGSDDNEREEPVLHDTPSLGNGETIFIVEDETNLRVAMEDLVSSFGYAVCSANSGTEALKMIGDGLNFDLLLTDIVMPGGVGGFDLAAQTRQLRSEIPVIYMSGYAAYTGQEMGEVVAPLLQKPCSPKLLAEQISAALSKTTKKDGS